MTSFGDLGGHYHNKRLVNRPLDQGICTVKHAVSTLSVSAQI